MSIDLSINPQKTTDLIIQFIKNTLKKTGFSKLVIGLSGGVDSAVSLALGVKAISASNVCVGIFPCGDLNKKGVDDAKMIVGNLKIPQSNVSFIDIKLLVDPILQAQYLGNHPASLARAALARLRQGNIMARMRMILLYDLSKKYHALVLGTENKTEHLLGYFTRFGDEASDLEPIFSLYKTQVKKLAYYLGVPEKIIKKIPTAGMWLGQTDEGELGFSYEDADRILHLWKDKKYKKEEIVKKGFDPDIVDRVLKRLSDNSFKHNLPYGI